MFSWQLCYSKVGTVWLHQCTDLITSHSMFSFNYSRHSRELVDWTTQVFPGHISRALGGFNGRTCWCRGTWSRWRPTGRKTVSNLVRIMTVLILVTIVCQLIFANISRKVLTSGDEREEAFLFQRVLVPLLRYNAVLLRDTLPAPNCMDWWSVPNFVYLTDPCKHIYHSWINHTENVMVLWPLCYYSLGYSVPVIFYALNSDVKSGFLV